MSALDTPQTTTPGVSVLTIEAGRTEKHYWADLWRYRELCFFLAWRDILVRYKQTVFGVAWALLRPLLTMLIFVLIFERIANLPSDGVPYPLLVMAAMLPWQFFSNSLSESGNSLVSNANLITKVYFPRLILPISSLVVAVVDFVITLTLLAVMMIWYSYLPDARLLAMPLFMLLAFITALGPGLLITAMNVKYRDFRFVVPFIVQFGLYVSPVGFSSTVISEKFGETARLIYSLNPMVGVIDGFRWCVGANVDLHPVAFPLSIIVSLFTLFLGIWYFRHTERTFADVI